MGVLVYIIKRLFKSGISVFSILLGRVIIFLFIAKEVGPSDFGKLSLSYALCSILGIVLDYGYPLSILKNGKKQLSEYGGVPLRVFHFKAVMSCVLSLLLILSSLASDLPIKVILLIWLSILITSFANVLSTFLKSCDKHGSDSGNALLSNVLGIIYCTLLFKDSHLELYALAFLVISIAYLFLTYYLYTSNFTFFFEAFSLKKLKNELSNNFYYAVDSVVQRGISFLDVIILAFFVSPAMVGLYQAGQKLMQGLLPVALVMNNVFMPLLSNSENEVKKWKNLSVLVMLSSALIGLFLASILFFGSSIIIDCLFSDEYSSLNEYAVFFALVIILKYIASGFSIVIISMGMQRKRFFINLFSIFSFVILSSLLTNFFAINGLFYALIANAIIIVILYGSILINTFSQRPKCSNLKS